MPQLNSNLSFLKPKENPSSYRYFRFFDQNDAAGAALCDWTEVELYGFRDNRTDPTDSLSKNIVCDVKFSLNGQEQVLRESVIYTNVVTALVSDIQPRFGYQLGNTAVQISGSGFGNDISGVAVLVDGVACTVTSVSNTKIACTTGAKSRILQGVSSSMANEE